jgi:hypothetical protein
LRPGLTPWILAIDLQNIIVDIADMIMTFQEVEMATERKTQTHRQKAGRRR